jgi:ABC-type multidrug transport system fused ATPase/permease subunit
MEGSKMAFRTWRGVPTATLDAVKRGIPPMKYWLLAVNTVLILGALAAAAGLLLGGGKPAFAQTPSANSSVVVTMDVSDFITFLKWGFALAGLFLATIAALAVSFFGFDVRKARESIQSGTTNLNNIIAEANSLAEQLKVMSKEQEERQNDLENLGAEAEAVADQTPPVSAAVLASRTLPDLIREIIQSSKFEWSTIDRIMKRTGQSREKIIETINAMPDIRPGRGRKSQDIIYRMKRKGEL